MEAEVSIGARAGVNATTGPAMETGSRASRVSEGIIETAALIKASIRGMPDRSR